MRETGAFRIILPDGIAAANGERGADIALAGKITRTTSGIYRVYEDVVTGTAGPG